jgi:hypothetical protein
MIWYKYTGRDPSWIIIASAFAPDFDIFSWELFKKLDMNIFINGAPIRFGDSFLFADIGGDSEI